MLAQIVLTPAEGKRLIAKSIAHMDIVQDAMREGTIVVCTSTTDAYVLEELTGEEVKDKGMFTAGVITRDGLMITEAKGRYDHHVFEKGKVRTLKTQDLPPILAKMGPGDIFIKGANAIDPFGAAGVLLGGAGGGTMGASWGYLTSNGVTTIIAAGLEKLVPISLTDVVARMGMRKVDYAMGVKCGLMVVQGAVITEMEAFKELFGVDVIPVGGGGIDGGEGSKIFLLDGEEEAVKAAVELAKGIKGEPQLKTRTQKT